ncbi:MAG TPA: DNA mismatch repair endonuclease MutL [Bacillaceae bacterium]
MREIIELDDALSNKIAAGEVVERPASVVKELAENAIDAGSTVIEIDIEEAGLGKIRVLDNGKGIGEEDAAAAFRRHATSKIKDENDLFRIRSLGFRGEALPSIASVSNLDIVTAQDGGIGTKLRLEGGKITLQEKGPGRKGTDITVTDLFYNTPARLKYLKTIHTEIGHISDIVNRLALAHPNISFRLRHHEKVLLQTNGNGDVRQVLAAIYGLNIAKNMIPIQGTSLDFNISGYISLPEVTRASRSYISTMVNGRFIKNYSLVKAVMEGYHTLLPIGRYPIVLLSIEMDPILVDVNVHPAKMEVRLSKEAELNELISASIRKQFRKTDLIPAMGPAREKKVPSVQTELNLEQADRRELPAQSSLQDQKVRLSDNEAVYRPKDEEVHKEEYSVQKESVHSFFVAKEPESLPPEPKSKELQETKDGSHDERMPQLYPIGQMHGTYILAQNERGLYIVDQHAAQERIKYEFFREKVGKVANELQDLLVPLTLEFSSDEYMKIMENVHELEKVGVFLENFGTNSFIVRSHPQWFPAGREHFIIEEMIEQLLSMKKVDIKKLREEAAIMMSCKASIKANQYLRNEEMQALLNDLRKTEDPFTCPHGRPIIIHYSTYEMEKMFKRIM